MSLANVEEIDAFVRDEVMPGIESQIVQNNAVLARLEGKDRYLADSGEHIRSAARYERLPGGAYPRGEKFSTEQRKTVKEYVLPWVMYYVDVTLDGWSKTVMTGKNAIKNFVGDKMDNGRETMSYNLNRGIIVFGGEDDEITGLPAICDDGTNYGTYANINRTTYTWAKAYLNATGGTYSNSMFQTAYGKCSKNNQHPDILITDQIVYNSIWNKMTPQQRFPSERHADLRALGFDGIEFNRAIILVDDELENDGLAYFINTNFLEFIVHTDRNMEWTGFKEHIDEDAYTGQIKWMGQMMCRAPRYFGQVQNIS